MPQSTIVCVSKNHSYNFDRLFVPARLRNVCAIIYFAQSVILSLTLETILHVVLILIFPYLNRPYVTKNWNFVLHINISAIEQIRLPQFFKFRTVSPSKKAHSIPNPTFGTPLSSSLQQIYGYFRSEIATAVCCSPKNAGFT